MKCLFLFLLGCGVAVGATEPEVLLSLHGSNTVGQKLVPALATDWAAREGWVVASDQLLAANERVIALTRAERRASILVYAHGTSTGLEALRAGTADLWMASRPVLPAEVKQHEAALGRLDDPEQEHVIALDGLAIIVHPANPIRQLGLDQVRAIFNGQTRNWSSLGSSVGTIRLYARDDKSGTFDTFKNLVLLGDALSPDALRFESTEELAARVAADPGAIGFVGLAGVGKSRPLALATADSRAMLPQPLTVATEDYALARRLFLYSSRQPSAAARSFVEFARSGAGQAIADRIGFVGQTMSLHSAQPDSAGLDAYRDLTEGAQRLSTNLRFGNGQSYLDSKAVRDLDRIAGFLRPLPRGSHEIVLIGFSDRREHNPVLALHMSNDRADFVATELARRGIPVHRSRGLGQSLPVADNDSEAGRSKNRRVEIWVRPRSSAQARRQVVGQSAPHTLP